MGGKKYRDNVLDIPGGWLRERHDGRFWRPLDPHVSQLSRGLSNATGFGSIRATAHGVWLA
jgi:hypothetical protein